MYFIMFKLSYYIVFIDNKFINILPSNNVHYLFSMLWFGIGVILC